MADIAHDGPGVRFPPPLLFVGGFVAGILADGVLPMGLLGPGGRHAAVIGGWSAIGAGLALAFWGIATFALARTAIMPHLPASRLVTRGPYRFTRNPMYSGLTLTYVGLTLLVDTAWPLVLLPIVLALLVRFVVLREEAYLDRTFGNEYRRYRARVRRWL